MDIVEWGELRRSDIEIRDWNGSDLYNLSGQKQFYESEKTATGARSKKFISFIHSWIHLQSLFYSGGGGG